MKVFKEVDRMNFVDDNNVFVGYDFSSSCCEHFGYYFSTTPQRSDEFEVEPEEKLLEGYVFDKNFFEDHSGDKHEEGGEAVFRLTADGRADLYLHLFNYHNGYYSHGFVVKFGEDKIMDGWL